ncbi:MAG: helix-hairpin-helix domain-containing protein [Thermodesulfobacteriota bacterium]|nr:helix-hairpin-helix domain-containing protein [Thermodesulfobacteriota bacterium]
MFNLKQQEILLIFIIIILSSVVFDYGKIFKNIRVKRIYIPEKQIVVEIEGNVKKEGIFHFTKGTTLDKALIKAGILSDKIAIPEEDLKRRLKNGTKIKIIREDDIEITNLEGIKKLVYFGQIDLNRADFNSLLAVPGIGPRIAYKILDYRKGNGGFKKKRELIKIKGIGKKNYRKIESYVRI